MPETSGQPAVAGTVVLEQPLRSNETHVPAREALADMLKRRNEGPPANQTPQEQPPPANALGEQAAPEETGTETPSEATDDGSVEMAADLPGLAKQLGIEEDHLLGLQVTRKVNGQDRTFTLKEALSGAMMEGDYRQKTSELAEQRRQIDGAVNQLTEHWKTRLETLDGHIAALEQFVGRKPDPAIAASDPAAYVAQLAAWQQHQDQILAAKVARDAERQRGQQEWQQRIQAYRNDQLRLARETIPELADPGQAEKFKGAMYSAASHYGLTGDELTQWINGAFDHRHLRIFADAIKYRTGAAQLDTNKLKSLPKVRIKPLASVGRPNASQAVDQALAKVKGLPSKSQDRRQATRELFKAKLAQRNS